MEDGTGVLDQTGLPDSLFIALPVGILLLDQAGHVISANRMAETLLGVRAFEMRDRLSVRAALDVLCRDCSKMPLHDVDMVEIAKQSHGEKPLEMVLARPDGSQVWLTLRATPLPEGSIAITLEDIGPRIRHVAALEAHTRLVEQADELDLKDLLGASLDELAALTGGAAGVFLFIDEDQESIRLQAWSTQKRGHGYPVESPPPVVASPGAWADAVKQKHTVVHNEGSRPADAWSLPDGPVQILRELVVPVVRKGKVRAVVGLANKPGHYDDTDVSLVERLANLSWELASLKLAKADAEQRAEQMQKVAASTPGLVCILRRDCEGRATLHHVSPVDDDFYGVPASGLAADLSGLIAQIHPEDRARLGQSLGASEQSLTPYHQRWRFQHSSKGWRWQECWAIPQREQDGGTLWYGFLMDVTAQAEAEAAAAENAARFEEAFEQAAIGMALTTLDFKLNKLNQAFCDMLGYAKEELLDSDGLALTHPNDRQATVEARQTVLAGSRTTCRLEKRYQHKDGHAIWAQVDYSLARASNGDPTHFVAQVHDISKRRRAEQERSLTVDMLSILNRTDDPSAASGQILTAIRAAMGIDAAAIRLAEAGDFAYAAHEGYSEEFLRSERCLRMRANGDETLPEEDRDHVFDCTCGRVARAQIDARNPMFTPNGSACIDNSPAMLSIPGEREQRLSARNRCFHFGYQSVLVVPVRSGERIVGILQLNDRRPHAFTPEQIAFLEGIAPTLGLALERKQAAAERQSMEQALRSSEERFARAFHSAPILGIISKIDDATIVEANQEFCRVTGYRKDELVGHSQVELGLTQPLQRREALQAMEREGKLRNYEMVVRCKDGRRISCLLSADVIETQGDRLLLTMITDVTEGKQAQAALRENDERFRLLIDHAPAALAMFDTDMRYLAVSRRWLEDYGLAGQNVLGKSHYEVFPEISETWKSIHRRALAGEAVSAKEDRFDREDGSIQWLRWDVLPWHHDDESIGGIVIFSEDITARKAAESETEASRAKLAAALESMTDAVFISDTEGQFIDFNGAFAAFHRFRSKEECVRNFAGYAATRELFFPSGAPAPIGEWPVRRALRGDVATNVEYRITKKDSGETWVGSYSFAPIRDAAKTIVGAVIVARDITEQKRAEQALHDVTERFRQISEAAKEWIWEVDAEGLYTYSSPVVELLLGYRPEELVGQHHFYDLWPVDVRTTLLPMAMEAFRRKEAFTNLPNTCLHKNGRPVLIETTGFPVVDASGALIGYRGADRDVTEREDAQAALRESEVRLRELFEHSPVAVWEEDLSAIAARFSQLRAQGVVDLHDYLAKHPEEVADLASRVRILEVNDASLKLLGASSLEELPRELPKYFNEGALAVFAAEMAELYEGKTKLETETPHLDIRGNLLDLQLRVSVLPGHVEDLSRVLVSFTDLTARKSAEAERHELEREVNHLQRLESLGRLASGVSHDMNNVLGAVMAIGSLLKARHKNDPVISKDADALLHAAVRGRDLVKGLRDFSRKELQSARQLDLNEIVQHEAELLERTTLKRVSIVRELAPNLPPVFGEASSIQNALMNLCVNAIDAMPDRGILTLSSRNLGQGFVELAVQDNGEGMPAEVLARALEPFFTTKPIGKGTGLGLSQVYGTVKAHGGTLDIQSKHGTGTRVSMTFPSVQMLADLRSPGGSASALGTGRPLKVLLVDDEEMVRGTVLSLLDVLGHEAQAASGGIEALRRLDAGMEVDLVMLDINMPGMDGVETLSRLRIARPDLRVLFATGHADERIPSILNRFPGVHILRKPFNITELEGALSDWP